MFVQEQLIVVPSGWSYQPFCGAVAVAVGAIVPAELPLDMVPDAVSISYPLAAVAVQVTVWPLQADTVVDDVFVSVTRLPLELV